jgi:hypothetical protein
MTAYHLDQAIAALARRQHGTFSRRQTRELGASASFARRRVANGSWLVLARGVYALPGNPATFQRQCMAAVLSERTAVVSGTSAAVLHGLEGFRPGRIELTVPADASHANPFATVRRATDFESTSLEGIPVTTLEQTLCDLTATLDPSRLEGVLDLALAARHTSVRALTTRVESLPNGRRRHLGPLVELLRTRDDDAFVPPTSVLEVALYRALDHPSLPSYVRQPSLPWRPRAADRADALIPDWRLIVEADGRAWHTRVADFTRDRQRDRAAVAAGHHVVRYVYDELEHDSDRVVTELLQIGLARCA